MFKYYNHVQIFGEGLENAYHYRSGFLYELFLLISNTN